MTIIANRVTIKKFGNRIKIGNQKALGGPSVIEHTVTPWKTGKCGPKESPPSVRAVCQRKHTAMRGF